MLPGVTVTDEPVTTPGKGLIEIEVAPETLHDRTVLLPALTDLWLLEKEVIDGVLAGALTPALA